jgi:hypothetical protein
LIIGSEQVVCDEPLSSISFTLDSAFLTLPERSELRPPANPLPGRKYFRQKNVSRIIKIIKARRSGFSFCSF